MDNNFYIHFVNPRIASKYTFFKFTYTYYRIFLQMWYCFRHAITILSFLDIACATADSTVRRMENALRMSSVVRRRSNSILDLSIPIKISASIRQNCAIWKGVIAYSLHPNGQKNQYELSFYIWKNEYNRWSFKNIEFSEQKWLINNSAVEWNCEIL